MAPAEDDLGLYVDAPAVVVWGAIVMLGAAAALCLAAAINSLGRGSEPISYGVTAAVFVLLLLRTWRYYRRPNLAMEGGMLVHRPFWRLIQRWPLAQITLLESRTVQLTPTGAYRRPMPIFVEELTVGTRDGKRETFTLPHVAGSNAAFLRAVSERTGVPLQETNG